jgi:cephalosporin-C deacetylase-like acetyl esterase
MLALQAQAPKKSAIQAASTRPDALFKVGETAMFKVESEVDGEAAYRLSEDGFKTVKEGKLTLAKGKATEVTGTLDKPGFLQLRVTLGKEEALAAAAFEPTKIAPTTKMPADFDSFWDALKKELAKIPHDAKLEHSPKHSDSKVECYKISLANVDGKRVHGWISVPKGKGQFPAILTVPYAGVYGIEPDKRHAQMGALAMNIIVHDLPVDEKPEFYEKQASGPLQDYRNIGMNDRQKSYFRQAVLACLRAADYLAGRPDFNGKDLAVTGGSQGGGLAIITAGAEPRVTLLAASVPALCDHAGIANDRISGWPQWLRRAKGDEAAKVLEASAYFDAVNFARKYKGKSLLSVGFIDTACPPTSVYSAFNVLPEPKTIIAAQRLGHSTDPRYGPARDEFWKKHLPLKPPE